MVSGAFRTCELQVCQEAPDPALELAQRDPPGVDDVQTHAAAHGARHRVLLGNVTNARCSPLGGHVSRLLLLKNPPALMTLWLSHWSAGWLQPKVGF